MKKLDLIIVGAQKAGTTSLKEYLGQHPHIQTHFQTEFSYFTRVKDFEAEYDYAFEKYFGEVDSNDDSRLIAKNAEIHFRNESFQRITQHNPDIQLVFMLRNPITRAHSAYQMALRDGWIKQSMDYCFEAVSMHKKGFYDVYYRFILDLGIYVRQIEEMYKYFSREQVHVIVYEKFIKNPGRYCKEIFRLLEVDESVDINYSVRHNIGGNPRSIILSKIHGFMRNERNPIKKVVKQLLSPEFIYKINDKVATLNKSERSEVARLNYRVEKYLKEFYRPFNLELSQLLDIDFDSIWH